MALRFYKIALIYLLFGMTMGIYMGIAHDFRWSPVHAHGNLLGWVSLALVGVAYQLFPAMAYSMLAPIHFWLHNVGLPLMLAGLAIMFSGNPGAGMPVAALGSVLLLLGIACLTINLWRNGHHAL